MNEILRAIYYNVRHPAGYGGLAQLQQATGATDSEMNEFALDEKIYQTFKPLRKRFPRAQAVYRRLGEVWASDTLYMKQLAPYNNGIQFLLIVICTLSKYLYVRGLKTLKGEEVTEKFESIIRENGGRPPVFLAVNGGMEYANEDFQTMCEFYGIKTYVTSQEVKSYFSERLILSLQKRIWPMLAKNNSWEYMKYLKSIVASYNHRRHRTTNLKPVEITEANQDQVLTNLNKKLKKQEKKPAFKVGDKVRVSYQRTKFEKSYRQSYTNETFVIYRIKRRTPTYLYFIQTRSGKPIEGGFYKFQLVKTRFHDSDKFS